MIQHSTYLRRASDVRYRHIAPETLVIRQSTPEVMVLNGVAGRTLDLLGEGAMAGALVAALQAEFAAPPEEIEREVLEFLDELAAAGVIE
jgi:hypothetical protein